MRIAMFTNIYTPQVGGVTNSIQRFTEGFRERGHDVLIFAPDYGENPESESDVVRVPAIPHFNGSDFSMVLPLHIGLQEAFDDFEPEVLHSHHPFLIGDAALRLAASRGRPLVLTYHTMYEYYTHYVPLDSPELKRFVLELSARYANLCDRVIAPSESVAEVLRDRGVETPIAEIPTGVDLDEYAGGDGTRMREALGIPPDAFVVGHLGRLAKEKNLPFLGRAVRRLVTERTDAHFLVVGDGDAVETVKATFAEAKVADRLHLAGRREGRDVVDAYHAMDVFAFSSHSETQGMVLVEALAAGCPLVALDAPGAREVVTDGKNGRLLREEDEDAFAEALREIAEMNPEERSALDGRARESAEPFATPRCVERALALYTEARAEGGTRVHSDEMKWESLLSGIRQEWRLWSNRAAALSNALSENNGESKE